jgi:hypothetical protein
MAMLSLIHKKFDHLNLRIKVGIFDQTSFMVCIGAECFTSACEVRDIFTLNFYARDVIKMGPRGSQIVEYGIIPFQKNKDIPTSKV